MNTCASSASALFRRLPLALLSLLLAGASTAAFAPNASAEIAPMRAGGPAPAAPAAPAAAPAAAITRGKVLETMNASNYTYARVKTDAGEKWVAGPETKLKVGDTAEWPGGMEMKNFTSKSMGKTFESILFVDRLGLAGTTPPPAAAAAAPHGAGGAPHSAISNKSESGPDVKGIAKAEGGVTVAEVYDRRAELDGKEVTVRGKVVKFNAGVMERNWLHLRDGSASKAGENDLTVTGDATAAVGDIVVVKGKVALNRDFGFGYRYDVLVEGATVKTE